VQPSLFHQGRVVLGAPCAVWVFYPSPAAFSGG